LIRFSDKNVAAVTAPIIVPTETAIGRLRNDLTCLRRPFSTLLHGRLSLYFSYLLDQL